MMETLLRETDSIFEILLFEASTFSMFFVTSSSTRSAVAPGQWVAPASPRAGQWDVRLRLTDDGGQHLDIRQRVVVR